jgi:hypothetical protein
MTELPRTIWLQVYGDGDKSEGLPSNGDEVTWCVDQINSNDVRYVIDKRHLKKAKSALAAAYGGNNAKG